MNNEIKEILDRLKEEDNYWNKQEHNYAFPDYYSLNREDLHLLLDYITNLQEENERLKELCNKYEEEHSTAFKLWTMRMEEIPDYEEKMDYKSRNEKAIEYINKLSNEPNAFGHYGIDGNCKKYLLNILNDSEKD